MGRFNANTYDPRTESSSGVDHEQGVLVLDQRGERTCHCGCLGEVAGAKSTFQMGHDARLRGKLIRAHLAGVPVRVHIDAPEDEQLTAELTAMTLAERYDRPGSAHWTGALRDAELKQGADVRRKLESANRGLLRRATGPQVGDRRLVKVGRWEYTGQVAAVYEVDGELEIEYVTRKGETKTARQPIDA